MDHRVDNKMQPDMFKTLAEMYEQNRRLQEKREQKIWTTVVLPVRLAGTFSRLTKNDLDPIRKNLNLKNMSTLNKHDLIQQLVKIIPSKFIEVLNFLDEERCELLVKMVKRGGFISANNMSFSKINFFINYGIAFPGIYKKRRILFMPKELIDTFNKLNIMKLKYITQRNTEWIRLTYGLLYYYGVMSTWTAMNTIKKLTGNEVDFIKYINVLSLANDYYQQVKISYAGLYDVRVIEPELLAAEQKKRPDLDYYPFSKHQLLKAGKPGYIDKTPAMDKLIHFLLEHSDIGIQEISELMFNYHQMINLSADPSELLRNLEQRFKFSSLEIIQQATALIQDMCNNTRMWVLKGYTPNEILQGEKLKKNSLSLKNNFRYKKADIIDFKTGKRIDCNDPCPCGSGEKFALCCGKNNA
ncbi:MAG: zinc chelation protein SecC [Peptococcaceae bacterium]|nr:zinc chelation protein SecC [Peptococcaceae bacterium]